MFGIIRPCRNRLGERLQADWLAHLCGMCLALRDEHGHLARLVTNHDALVVSALVEAQVEAQVEAEAQAGCADRRRRAGPCALRGMRRASVATGEGARLAASVSLLLASSKLADHVQDGDVQGALRTRTITHLARRWEREGIRTAAEIGFDAGAVLTAVAGQAAAESGARSVLDVTAPTERATALAFARTAAIAGQPQNATVLAEAGALFGRLAHLLDAVQDRAADQAAGRWNPIIAFGLSSGEVRALCDDAALGLRLALADVRLTDGGLVHALLVHELATAVDRAFAAAGRPDRSTPSGLEAPPRRGPVLGCVGWLVVCGTRQACCSSSFTDPCSGRERQGFCHSETCRSCADDSDNCCCDCAGDCCCDAVCNC